MKVNRDVVQSIKEKTSRPTIVPFEIDGVKYEVAVFTTLTMALREKMIQIATELIAEELNELDTQLVGLLMFLKVLTDIEWTGDFQTDVDLMVSLADYGVVAKIFAVIPDTLLEQTHNFMMEISQTGKTLAENN